MSSPRRKGKRPKAQDEGYTRSSKELGRATLAFRAPLVEGQRNYAFYLSLREYRGAFNHLMNQLLANHLQTIGWEPTPELLAEVARTLDELDEPSLLRAPSPTPPTARIPRKGDVSADSSESVEPAVLLDDPSPELSTSKTTKGKAGIAWNL